MGATDSDTRPDVVVYESERTRVTRVRVDHAQVSHVQCTLLCKQPLGPEASQRAQHETDVLRRLAQVPGVCHLASIETIQGHPSPSGQLDVVYLDDPGGEPLSAVLTRGRLDLDTVLELATSLARTVAQVHACGVVHKDISPDNILLCGISQHPVLIDFDLSGIFVEEYLDLLPYSAIQGWSSYTSPEQTGRTGWPIDQRADLYALGAVLYELSTGRAPFSSNDPLRLMHSHLTRIPTAPAELNPEISLELSAVIMHLLEKSPNQRYQSAEGLRQDLLQVSARRGDRPARNFELGKYDFPQRLAVPGWLVGRDHELEVLAELLGNAAKGQRRLALVRGEAGVGKTALLQSMRAMVAAVDGWFIPVAHDRARPEGLSDAATQVLEGAARILLAQPQFHFRKLRDRLGVNASLLVTQIPQLGPLLGVEPGDELAGLDPATTQARLYQTGLEVLAAIARPGSPLILFFDDLQWAGASSLTFFQTVSATDWLGHVLIVGAYRESRSQTSALLTENLRCWKTLDPNPRDLPLANLDTSQLSQLLASMLRLPQQRVAGLAEQVKTQTLGNPLRSIEFVNTVRQEGLLTLTEGGWQWDDRAIHDRVGPPAVVEYLMGRVERLPARTRELLTIAAHLGGSVELEALNAVLAPNSSAELEEWISPAIAEGLAEVRRDRRTIVRFTHDWVQQTVYRHLPPAARKQRHLAIARALTAAPGFVSITAEQYAACTDLVTDPLERRQVVRLLRDAAQQAQLLTDYSLVDHYLGVASQLLEATDPDPGDADLRLGLWITQHWVCHALGRFSETDALFHQIQLACPDPLLYIDTIHMRIAELQNRDQDEAALDLGIATLAGLGFHPGDPDQVPTETDTGLTQLLNLTTDTPQPEQKPACCDPVVLAASRTILKITGSPRVVSSPRSSWVLVLAVRLWAGGHRTPDLAAALANACLALIPLRQDYATAHLVARRMLQFVAEHGHDPVISEVRLLYAAQAAWWFEPFEQVIQLAQQARDGLVRTGDLQAAGKAAFCAAVMLFDCSPGLAGARDEVDTGLAFAAQTNNQLLAGSLTLYQEANDLLRGQRSPSLSYQEDFPEHLPKLQTFQALRQIIRALLAALLAQPQRLTESLVLAEPYLQELSTGVLRTTIELLRVLDLAQRARMATGDQREELLARLTPSADWLADRATNAPSNFLHLSWLAKAELAWATGDPDVAAIAFDHALTEVSARTRPWHRALITERLARFHLEREREYAGRAALREALLLYQLWGATAKVQQLQREFPFLEAESSQQPAGPGPSTGGNRHPSGGCGSASSGSDPRSSLMPACSVDALAILRASQALSSDTNLSKIRERLSEILRSLTGATAFNIAIWASDTEDWVLLTEDGTQISADEAAISSLVPLAAFRYAERTREPLLSDDVIRDDRFGRDPYFSGMKECALMVVPIFSRGRPRAMLMLENRNSRAAFGVNRLETVLLIAGQLSTSLDNALLYAELERKVATRTEDLRKANEKLAQLAITDPLTGIANRRRLKDILSIEWRHSIRTQAPIGIAMIDIDHFKRYNDGNGHLVGDECLRLVASTINRSIRDTDLLARYGGEEFVVVLPRADLPATRNVAERIRRSIEHLARPHATSSHLVVTVSVGVASRIASRKTPPEDLIDQADSALYRAKSSGRNQVSI